VGELSQGMKQSGQVRLLDLKTPSIRKTVGIKEGIGEVVEKVKGTMRTTIKADGKVAKSNDKIIREYFIYIKDIGTRSDLTTEEKLLEIHKAYRALGEGKGDVTVLSDIKYLKPEGFGPNGRMIIDWPDKMGFFEDSIQSINRANPLPEHWDRIGGMGGENFTTIPNNGMQYSYDQRAIPYLENLKARHIGTFDNESYFDAIDAIKSGNLEELNRIVVTNGKKPISNIEFDRFKASYTSFLSNVKTTVGDIDATYGLKGTAASWSSSSTEETLMSGGAEQIVTPLNAEMLEIIGIIPKY
jgi:hypothetical protein